MTTTERDEFIAFVRDAGEVDPVTLPKLVEKAAVLVTLHDGQTLIGTAAIKVPYQQHRRSEFRKAKVDGQANEYPLELGRVHVHLDHRGKQYSSALVAKAIEAAPGQGLYAATKSDLMKRTLLRHGFAVQGEPYPSTLDSKATLTLFGRPT